MKALFYRTFYVNMDFSFFAFLGPLLLCVVPIPWLYLPEVVAGLPLLLLFQRDYRDQWDDLAATLPLPTWMVVAEKFLLAAACTVVYPLMMALMQMFAADAYGEPFFPPTGADILLAMGSLLLFFGCYLLLMFWRGPRRAGLMFFAAIALPSLLVTLILFLAGNDDLFYQHLPPSLLVMAAWFVASFLLSLRLYTHQKVGSSRAIPLPGHRLRDRTSFARAVRVRGKRAPLRALLYKDCHLIFRRMPAFLIGLVVALYMFRYELAGADLCMLPMLGMVVPLQLMALDEHAKWTFALRLYPYPPQAVVLSRYFWGWVFTLVGVVLSVGTAYLVYPQAGYAVPPNTPIFLCWLVGLVLIILAVEIPLLFRTGVSAGKMISIGLLVFFWILLGNLLARINEDNPLAALPQVLPLLVDLAPLVPLIGLAVNLLSIPLAVREYRLSAAAT